MTPGQRIAKRNVPAEPTETTGAARPRLRISSAVSTAARQASQRQALSLGVVPRLRVDVPLVGEDACELEPRRSAAIRSAKSAAAAPGTTPSRRMPRVELEQRADRRARAREATREIPAATSSESTVTEIATRLGEVDEARELGSPTIG